MNPRTHPVGARPDFTLPKPNPNPQRMTDALWWLVCMRERLEPDLSENGGTFAAKPGSHNIGGNLPDHGEGNAKTDHSIRHAWNRSGPWWRSKCAAHDWTFLDAQRGDYRTINRYTRRMIAAMSDPDDLRPDQVVFYTLGNIDGDVTTEGYNELKNGPEYSGDTTHAWHRHDSFFRNAVGDFWAMWRVLTIDMGWTYEQWKQSIEEDDEVTEAQLIAAVTKALTGWTEENPDSTATPKARARVGGFIRMSEQRAARRHAALVALIGGITVNADEQAIAGAVLAGLSPEAIAAALPGELAEQVAQKLADRLAS